jgi:hypothetical protein
MNWLSDYLVYPLSDEVKGILFNEYFYYTTFVNAEGAEVTILNRVFCRSIEACQALLISWNKASKIFGSKYKYTFSHERLRMYTVQELHTHLVYSSKYAHRLSFDNNAQALYVQ